MSDISLSDVESLDGGAITEEEGTEAEMQEYAPEEHESDEEQEEEDMEDLDDGNDDINVSESQRFEIVSKDKTYELLERKNKKMSPFMNPYELTKIIGIRSQELAGGMPPLITVEPGMMDTKKMAIQELLSGKIAFIIRRYYPDKSYEDWRVSDLIIPTSNILQMTALVNE